MKRKTKHQIAGAEKKICQCCGKLLGLQTWIIRVPKDTFLPPPKPGAVNVGYVPRAEVSRKRSSLAPELNEEVEYWDGHYRGYDNRWCSLICARRFANACYSKDMRFKGIKA